MVFGRLFLTTCAIALSTQLSALEFESNAEIRSRHAMFKHIDAAFNSLFIKYFEKDKKQKDRKANNSNTNLTTGLVNGTITSSGKEGVSATKFGKGGKAKRETESGSIHKSDVPTNKPQKSNIAPLKPLKVGTPGSNSPISSAEGMQTRNKHLERAKLAGDAAIPTLANEGKAKTKVSQSGVSESHAPIRAAEPPRINSSSGGISPSRVVRNTLQLVEKKIPEYYERTIEAFDELLKKAGLKDVDLRAIGDEQEEDPSFAIIDNKAIENLPIPLEELEEAPLPPEEELEEAPLPPIEELEEAPLPPIEELEELSQVTIPFATLGSDAENIEELEPSYTSSHVIDNDELESTKPAPVVPGPAAPPPPSIEIKKSSLNPKLMSLPKPEEIELKSQPLSHDIADKELINYQTPKGLMYTPKKDSPRNPMGEIASALQSRRAVLEDSFDSPTDSFSTESPVTIIPKSENHRATPLSSRSSRKLSQKQLKTSSPTAFLKEIRNGSVKLKSTTTAPKMPAKQPSALENILKSAISKKSNLGTPSPKKSTGFSPVRNEDEWN